jgi:hypothetical protein
MKAARDGWGEPSPPEKYEAGDDSTEIIVSRGQSDQGVAGKLTCGAAKERIGERWGRRCRIPWNGKHRYGNVSRKIFSASCSAGT